MRGLLPGLLALLALAAFATVAPSGTAQAETYEQFVEDLKTTDEHGNDRTEAALMELRAKESAAAIAQAQKTSQAASGFFGAAKNLVKKQYKRIADIAGEAMDVIGAYITGGPMEGLIQFAGSLADILVEHGIPLAALRVCPRVINPFAIGACFGVAFVLSKLDDEAEEYVKRRVREGLSDDDEDVTRNRDRRYSGNIRIRAATGDISSIAVGAGSTAVTDIGVARGGNVEIDAQVDNVTTSGRSGGDAYTAVGVAEGDNVDIEAHVGGDIGTFANNDGSANTQVGVAAGGEVEAMVGGDIVTNSDGGRANTLIGTSTGSDVDAMVGGDVFTDAGRGNATTRIGTGKSAYIGGTVINDGGDLSVGGLCVAERHGRCCIEIHRRLCVYRKVPPDSKGRCPPGFEKYGWCYLYSDKAHQIRR